MAIVGSASHLEDKMFPESLLGALRAAARWGDLTRRACSMVLCLLYDDGFRGFVSFSISLLAGCVLSPSPFSEFIAPPGPLLFDSGVKIL